MNREQLIGTIEDILEVPHGTVSPETTLDSLEWDSLANISLISELDQRFGVRVDAQFLSDATTIEQLIALVPTAS